jgi:hypothetical protein
MFAINQNSLKFANFSTTYAGTLALVGNAILAVAGKSEWSICYYFVTNYQKSDWWV